MSSEDMIELQNLVNKSTKNVRVFRSSQKSFQEFQGQIGKKTAKIIEFSRFKRPKYETPYKISPLNDSKMKILITLRGYRGMGATMAELKQLVQFSDGDFMRLLIDGLIVNGGYKIRGQNMPPIFSLTSFGREVLNDIERRNK